MKKLHCLAAAAVAALAGSAMGTPLRLDYCVTDLGGGTFHYVFVLTLDNNDGTWAAGQAWRWLIFGDQNSAPSPLTGWVDDGTVWPVGPWTSFTSSGGGHNGPTMNYVLDYWTPAAVGDRLVWEGDSTADLQEPLMLFSTLAGTLNNGVAADFEVAHRLAGGCNGPTGACCRTDGSCIITTNSSCTNQGGIYRGDNTACATANCPQPPTGACCHADGSCTVLTQAQCVAARGTYRGDNASCATANCPITGYIENGDAGSLPGTAAVVSGSGPLTSIQGTLGDTADVDMYQINICNPANFNATTVGGTTIDTMMFLFHADGTGIAGNDDSQNTTQSTITNTFVSSLTAGNYYLAVTMWDDEPEDANAANLWSSVIPEAAPNGPGAANPVAEWSGAGQSTPGAYTIFLQGSCFVGGAPTCYPNCDHSTTAPCLNVADFTCFLNSFANGSSYANCDNSTTPPVLNVGDFTCFLNSFATGCGTNC